jgi:RNA polymerase sigma-70 factor (ECF subfamily)
MELFPAFGRISTSAMTEHRSDEALVLATAVGDRAAFAELYRRRHRDVFRFALHMSGSPAVADDVMQDVFVAVIGAAATFTRGRAVVPWLLGIARNFVRRRADRERALEPLPEPGASAERRLAVDVDPSDAMTRAERLDSLRRALKSLPPRYREPVVLCDLQELSYADAAAAIGCAIGTVRSRLHRGRVLLASRLRREARRDEDGTRLTRWVV